MTYTFLHRGVVMGESDLSGKPQHRRQKIGSFHPTAYGETLLPQVTCILSASRAFKAHLLAMAPKAKSMTASELEAVLYESDAGRAMVDIGRVLSEVEVRGPDRRCVEFDKIAFSDIHLLREFANNERPGSHEQLRELPEGVSQFTVSIVLRPMAQKMFAAGRAAIGRKVGHFLE